MLNITGAALFINILKSKTRQVLCENGFIRTATMQRQGSNLNGTGSAMKADEAAGLMK